MAQPTISVPAILGYPPRGQNEKQQAPRIGAQHNMARSGNLAELERRLAARREDERLARERKRQEKEQGKLREQEQLESARRAAGEQTAAVQEQVKSLDEVLTSALDLPPMSFERLLVTARTPPFDAGPLGTPEPAPDWNDFAPSPPSGLRRFRPAMGRRRRQGAQARARFEAAAAGHRQRESQRHQDLAVARAKYHGKVTEERARAAARNAYIARRQSAFGAGDPESVAWFARCVLKASRYPDGFPRDYRAAYDPGTRTVAVEFELPPRGVVPPARGYRHVPGRDATEPVPRPEPEITKRYDRLVAGIALRTLHEIFSATAPDVVAAVSFTGYVTTTDRATGQPVRPHLLSVSAPRPAFERLVLAEVDPAACLAGLGAQATA
jgi:restriction system protein